MANTSTAAASHHLQPTRQSSVTQTPPALVPTDWLAAHLNDPDVRIADVRWYLPHLDRRGLDEYRTGHIPSAVFVDLDAELAAPRGSGPGRHPLPSAEQFAAAMSRAGIGDGTYVVAYDDSGGAIAARLWWLLRYFGHERVSVLDGGISRWIAEDRLLEMAMPAPHPARFTARPRQGWVIDRVAVRQLATDPNALVLDARAPERYEGAVEPIDPRPGHIPGAKSAPYAANLRDEPAPRLKSPEQLRAQFDALGVPRAERVAVYCGSGVTACHDLLALYLAGYQSALLYEGSWSDWSSDPSLPAATGPNP